MPPVHHCCTNLRCGCPVFRVNRLRGHRDEVTDARFVASGAKLITSSKDTFLKVCTREMEGWGFSAHAVVGFLTLAAVLPSSCPGVGPEHSKLCPDLRRPSQRGVVI